MVRRLTFVSLSFWILFGFLSLWTIFRPLDVILYDSAERKWFPSSTFVPAQLADFDEPASIGLYPNPSIDAGVFPSYIYVRMSQYLPTTIQTSDTTFIENLIYDKFPVFERRFPAGILWKRVWRQGQVSTVLAIPICLVLTILTFIPAWYIANSLRKRACKGLCPTCHYDLRAHNPGDKCPECGTLIASKPKPQ